MAFQVDPSFTPGSDSCGTDLREYTLRRAGHLAGNRRGLRPYAGPAL